MNRNLMVVLLGLVVFGCATSSQKGVRIVEQSDPKPNWATLTKTTYEEDGKVKFFDFFTTDFDARPDAAVDAAKLRAFSKPLEAMADDFLDQAGIVGDLRDASAKRIINALRKNPPNIAGLTSSSSYYERVEIGGDKERAPKRELRAFALVECTLAEYNKAKEDALKRLNKEAKHDKELDDLLKQQRERAAGKTVP